MMILFWLDRFKGDEGGELLIFDEFKTNSYNYW